MQACNQVVVVIPLYKTDLQADERLSLKRTLAVLGHYPIVIACPLSLDLAPLADYFADTAYTIERFFDQHFKSVITYNALVLSEDFYSRFTDFDYLLICQTDVFVFDDQLSYWCNKHYDYIGAPWIASDRNVWNKLAFAVRNLFAKKKKSNDHYFKVGNGGFSLRKVATMCRIATEQREKIDYCLAHPNNSNHHIEDIYISLVAPTLIPEMRIPDYREAVAFCMDRKPQIAMGLNNNRLPFACHGFNKKKVRSFWKPIIDAVLSSDMKTKASHPLEHGPL